MALKPPAEVPQGAIRLNTDSQKLEFFAQDQWWEMETDFPYLGSATTQWVDFGVQDQLPSARGIMGGGAADVTIDYITIATQANAADFGDLSETKYLASACASRTRGVFQGGYTSTGPNTYTNHMEYVTIASIGSQATFGDLTQVAGYNGACSNSTRGIRFGGTAPVNPSTDRIDYYTIAQTGNAVDFGNLTVGAAWMSDGTCNSPTRGITVSNGNSNKNIEYITISTTGNSIHFGDLEIGRSDVCGVCNSIRGCFGGGYLSPGETNVIEYITISTMGDGTDFGDMTVTGRRHAGMSSPTRGVWGCGLNPNSMNTMDFITIPTMGDATDFGNASVTNYERAGLSNAHGGL